MIIELRADQPGNEAAAWAATGRSVGEWFALLDELGGPSLGRRNIGNHLVKAHKLDPWWVSTLSIGYEAAHGVVERDGRPKGYTICATKSIRAAPGDCFAAFAEAGALDAWLGTGHELDFRDGGSLANADGNCALIRKINPGKSIRMVWGQPGAAPGTPVEVKLQPAAAKTTVMITHDRLQTRAEADGFRRAWGDALGRLRAYLEGP
ncbi:MAG TPA: SRPBCC domain-containing protein [Gammaproteobacteria bacterium]|nr:SRPBCC domain-containing protein [Gammaproteobacteria bacterium]